MLTYRGQYCLGGWGDVRYFVKYQKEHKQNGKTVL